MSGIALLYRKRIKGRQSIESVFKPLDKIPGIHKTELPCELNSLKNALKLMMFALKLKERNIHITGDVHFMAILLFWKRIILNVHDCNHYEDLKGFRKLVYGLIWFRLPIIISKKIVVISPYVYEQLNNHFKIKKNKVEIIPNWFQVIESHKQQKKPSVYTILTIGTKTNKNLERLIRALNGFKDIKVKIVGNLAAPIIELLDENDIRYENLFDLSRKELEKQFNSSDLLFFASTKEGFGLPILEAQSCGLPVVTSSTTSMPYVAGKGACIIDPYNTKDIKNAIIKVKTNSSYRQKIINAGFLNIKRFDENGFLNSYVALYKNTFKIPFN